jgi:hypothetical protein
VPLHSDLFVAATSLPNIDGRNSVLVDLPKDLFMQERQSFAVGQKPKSADIAFTHPADWAMCHPDPDRFKVMLCVKDKGNRKLYPIVQSLVDEYPRLQVASRPYIVRQAKLLDGPWFLWPAPWPGGRELLGDNAHYEAQIAAMSDWTLMTWAGHDWDVMGTETPNAYAHPEWDKAEDFELFLNRGLGPIVLLHAEQTLFIRRFLGKA